MGKVVKWILIIFIGIPLLWAVVRGCSSDPVNKNDEANMHVANEQSDNEKPSPYETLPKFAAYQSDFDDYIGAQVTVVQMLVRKQMKDPDSAEFRNWSYIKASESLPATVCGEVNAKNSFNGYSGFKKFLFKTDTTEFGLEGSTKNFNDEYNKYCVLK